MIKLGLDLAGKTGYAIRYDTGEWKVGLWTLDRGNLGGTRSPIPAVRLLKRLNRLADDHDVESVSFEETFARGNAKFRLDSLQTIVMLWAVQRNIPWMRISVMTVKKWAGGYNKGEVLARAKEKWPQLRIWSFDQADALWVLDYSLQRE